NRVVLGTFRTASSSKLGTVHGRLGFDLVPRLIAWKVATDGEAQVRVLRSGRNPRPRRTAIAEVADTQRYGRKPCGILVASRTGGAAAGGPDALRSDRGRAQAYAARNEEPVRPAYGARRSARRSGTRACGAVGVRPDKPGDSSGTR